MPTAYNPYHAVSTPDRNAGGGGAYANANVYGAGYQSRKGGLLTTPMPPEKSVMGSGNAYHSGGYVVRDASAAAGHGDATAATGTAAAGTGWYKGYRPAAAATPPQSSHNERATTPGYAPGASSGGHHHRTRSTSPTVRRYEGAGGGGGGGGYKQPRHQSEVPGSLVPTTPLAHPGDNSYSLLFGGAGNGYQQQQQQQQQRHRTQQQQPPPPAQYATAYPGSPRGVRDGRSTRQTPRDGAADRTAAAAAAAAAASPPKRVFSTPPATAGQRTAQHQQQQGYEAARGSAYLAAAGGTEAASPRGGSNAARRPSMLWDGESDFIVRGQADEDRGKYCVVLDLDETLVFARNGPIQLRPGCKELIRLLGDHCETVVWTAGERSYAKEVLQKIDDVGAIRHCVYRHHLWFNGQAGQVKDLGMLGRNPDRVLLVENTPDCLRKNATQSVLVPDFRGTCRSNTLYGLIEVVKSLVKSNLPVAQFLRQTSLVEPREVCTNVGDTIFCHTVAGGIAEEFSNRSPNPDTTTPSPYKR